MDKYFLFRDDNLVGTNDPNLTGAGDLHDMGQKGDVLVSLGRKRLKAWKWCNSSLRKNSISWQSLDLTEDQERHYRTLLLLLT